MPKLFALLAAALCALQPATAFAQPYEHLKCYKFRDTQTFRSAEADIETIEVAFGLQNCDIKRKAKQFCIPASKAVTSIVEGVDSPFPAQDLGFNQICYKIRCPNVTIPDQQLSDQFGTRTGSRFKASLLCVPAVIGLPPTTSTTTTSTTTTITTTTTLGTTFSVRAGDTGAELAVGVAVDSLGNTIAVGSYSSATDFGNGPLPLVGASEIFVVKLDPSGAAIWSQGFAGAGISGAFDVALDSADNIIVTGNFSSTVDFGGGPLTSAGGFDAFVVKLDTNGSHLWSAKFGDLADDSGRDVAVDASNAAVLIGSFKSAAIDFGGGPLPLSGVTDAYVAKLDASGAHVWSKAYGGVSATVMLNGVATDSTGNVLVTGGTSGTVDFGGGPLASANTDVVALKLTSGGAHLSSAIYGDAASQQGINVAVDSANNVYLTGSAAGATNFGGGGLSSAGLTDAFLVKFDSLGAHLWSQIYGDASSQTAFGLAVDGSGNVHVSGSFAGSIDFGGGPLTSTGLNDIFLMKRTSAGAHLSSQRFGDAATQGGGNVDTDAGGNRYLVGFFGGTVDFGDGPLNDAGGGDAYIAKLAP